LKKFKRKFEKTGAVREMRARKTFEKPSVKRRVAKMKAIYVQHLRLEEDQ
ncbi:MAG: 30S ribosomal protein S21, partial [Bacteroidales bacterium]|nr:30S ribosomal protein S21 [Bacteroidales bacterium]